MLSLTRKEKEIVLVGDNIIVKVLAIKGNQVTLGFEAPKHIRVDREEVRLRINSEKEHLKCNMEEP